MKANNLNKKHPVILAISAASGIIYGIRILDFLLQNKYNVELIISSKAYYIAKQEIDLELCHCKNKIKKKLCEFLKLENNQENLKIWLDDEIWANPSSGSYQTQGMIIAPASMATISAISVGHAENLITRSADVCIKEKRTLTLVPRETPLNSIHLENMLKLSKLGVNIVPPVPGFYGNIKTLNESINFVAGKILDSHDISNNLYERWHL